MRKLTAALLVLIVSILALGCSQAASDRPTAHVADLSTPSPAPPSATIVPTATPLPTSTPEPMQLVVLHTNDNWGETEPCG